MNAITGSLQMIGRGGVLKNLYLGKQVLGQVSLCADPSPEKASGSSQ